MVDRERDGAFPPFEHSQWTSESSDNRFDAFARGTRNGGRRAVAIVVVLLLILPIALGLVGVVQLIN